MKDRFYFACLRDNVGGNVAWWAKSGGYTTNVSNAESYSRVDAQRMWNGHREFDMPISADHVDPQTVLKVDMQYVPNESQIIQDVGYVGFARQRYKGNDLYFISDDGLTIDFNQAKMFTAVEARQAGEYVFLPYELVNAQARKTFDFSKYNRRTMTQGAGLKTPAHILRARRRKLSNKVRMNCPVCGKIAWQLNPYHFDACSDPTCFG